jgi:hypothetical protein
LSARTSIGQQLELHDGSRGRSFGGPAPHTLRIRFELRVQERPLEAGAVDRSGRDLQIHLDIDVRSPGVFDPASRTEQCRDEASQDDELRPRTVVVDDADQRPFGGGSGPPAPKRLVSRHR